MWGSKALVLHGGPSSGVRQQVPSTHGCPWQRRDSRGDPRAAAEVDRLVDLVGGAEEVGFGGEQRPAVAFSARRRGSSSDPGRIGDESRRARSRPLLTAGGARPRPQH